MQIDNLDKMPALRLTLSGQEGKGLALRDGQLLNAMVRQIAVDGLLSLEVEGRVLEARSNLRLVQGMVLAIRVERQGDQILLHLDPQQLKQHSHDQALRQLLPRQESLKPLFEQLQQAGIRPSPLTSPPPISGERVHVHTTATATLTNTLTAKPTSPPSISRPDNPLPVAMTMASNTRGTLQQAIGELLTQLPKLQQLTQPAGLQQSLLNSGLFLEQHILHPRADAPPDADVKNILLRLAHLIRQSLSQNLANPAPTTSSSSSPAASALSQEQLEGLLKQTESSIARIQMNQLTALTTQTRSEERLLNIELPLLLQNNREPEMLTLQIRRGNRGGGGQGEHPVWSVRLQLEPEGYGHIEAIVTLLGGKVSTTFWCHEQSTSALFARNMEQLIKRFDEQGLEVGNCRAIFGQAPAETEQPYPTSISLIDIQA